MGQLAREHPSSGASRRWSSPDSTAGVRNLRPAAELRLLRVCVSLQKMKVHIWPLVRHQAQGQRSWTERNAGLQGGSS